MPAHDRSFRSLSPSRYQRIAEAMATAIAAASMAMAPTARLPALSSRAHTNFTRDCTVSRMGAPAASFSSMFCTFAAFSVMTSSTEAPFLARASQVGTGEVVAEEVEVSVAAEEVEAPVAVVRTDQQQQGKTLYVGNLPWSYRGEDLADICMQFGAVETVELVYDRENGYSRGFAFVTMASNEDAQAVIKALNGSDVLGRVLTVDFPKPSPNNPRVFKPGPGMPGNENKLFVGNLVWACDEKALSQLFSACGKVVEAKVVYNQHTGRSRGFGFVKMGSAKEVDTAQSKLHGAEYGGRKLTVDKVARLSQKNSLYGSKRAC